MWGIIPAAGRGSRIQPLAFSKELLPVGSRRAGTGDRPCAVSEYLVERMICGGVDKLAFVIGPGKSDILSYYGAGYEGATVAYLVQPSPAGLCDAIFRAAPFLDDEAVLIGLPDTIWFPREGFTALPDDRLSFLLFPVARPDLFDAVLMNEAGRVQSIEVKRPGDTSRWIWGAIKMPSTVFHALHRLWKERDRRDEYFGTLVNAYLVEGGEALGVRAGESYVDVGTLDGYRSAMQMLDRPEPREGQARQGVALAEPLGRSPAKPLAQ
jgi:dTDP-glucose pyrophosphorylase